MDGVFLDDTIAGALKLVDDPDDESVVGSDDETLMGSDDGATSDQDIREFLEGAQEIAGNNADDDDDDDNPKVYSDQDDGSDDDTSDNASEFVAEEPKEHPAQRPELVVTKRSVRKSVSGERVRKDISQYFKVKLIKYFKSLPPETKRGEHLSKLREWQAETFAKDPINRAVIINSILQVKGWMAAQQRAPKQFGGKKKRNVLKASVRYLPLDVALDTYMKAERAQNKRVRLQDLQTQATEIGREIGILKGPEASLSYVRRFMERRNWLQKRIKRQSLLTPQQVQAKTQSMHNHVARIGEFTDAVVNFDEVPMSLSGCMGALKTIASGDDQTICANFDPSDTKRCCSLIPFFGVMRATREAFHLVTIVLLIGEPKRDAILSEHHNGNVVVAWTKSGIMNTKCMTDVVLPTIRKKCNERGIRKLHLIMDSCKSHTPKCVIEECYRLGLYVTIIPGGMTSYVQWVDVFFAAKYRLIHSEMYRPYEGKKKTSKVKRQLLVKLIVESMKSFGPLVADQFERLGYLDPSRTRVHTLNGYVFVPPTAEERMGDAEKMERRVRLAKEAGTRNAAQASCEKKQKQTKISEFFANKTQ